MSKVNKLVRPECPPARPKKECRHKWKHRDSVGNIDTYFCEKCLEIRKLVDKQYGDN